MVDRERQTGRQVPCVCVCVCVCRLPASVGFSLIGCLGSFHWSFLCVSHPPDAHIRARSQHVDRESVLWPGVWTPGSTNPPVVVTTSGLTRLHPSNQKSPNTRQSIPACQSPVKLLPLLPFQQIKHHHEAQGPAPTAS